MEDDHNVSSLPKDKIAVHSQALLGGCVDVKDVGLNQTPSVQLTNQASGLSEPECSRIKLLEGVYKEAVLKQALNDPETQRALASLRYSFDEQVATIMEFKDNGAFINLPDANGNWLGVLLDYKRGKTTILMNKAARANITLMHTDQTQSDQKLDPHRRISGGYKVGRRWDFLTGHPKTRLLIQLYNLPRFSEFLKRLKEQSSQIDRSKTVVALNYEAKLAVVALALWKEQRPTLEYTVLAKIDDHGYIVSVVDVQPVKRCVITLKSPKHISTILGTTLSSTQCTEKVKAKVSFNLLIFTFEVEYEKTQETQDCKDNTPPPPPPPTWIFDPCEPIPLTILLPMSNFDPALGPASNRASWRGLAAGCTA